MAEKSFPFIVVNGPKVNDPEARAIIRKQAMKDVGNARRRRGNYGRVNMRQLPKFDDSATNIPFRSAVSSDSSDLTSPETTDSTDSTEATDYDEIIPRKDVLTKKKYPVMEMCSSETLSFSAINLFSNYETARAKFRIDVVDLAILTNFNVSKSAIPVLSADPMRLASILGLEQWSYLQFVPSLYGSKPCLTAATNCVLAKVKGILSPHEQCKEVTLRLYAKALRVLQDAIARDTGCMEADVLCATQLLSLHELLDTSRDTAWSHHIDGSARLIKHRTPERFKTEFERALFAAHVGPIMSECLMTNRYCYLEEPEWTALYRSLIQDTHFLSDRSLLTVNVRSLMFPISGMWHDIHQVVKGDQLFDDCALAALTVRCHRSHQDLLGWMEDYKSHCVKMSLTLPPQQELTMRRELFGAASECLAIVKRLLATVCDAERSKLEKETQALAQLIMDLQKQPSPKHSWLFAGHEVGVAAAIISTEDQWAGDFFYHSEYERRIASRTRYNTWDNTLRTMG